MSEDPAAHGADPDTAHAEVTSLIGGLLAEWETDMQVTRDTRCDDINIDSMILMVEVAADMCEDPWPSADIVPLADVLHNWPVGVCTELLAHPQPSTPASTLMIHEMLTDGADRRAAATVAASAVTMAAVTGGQQFSTAELTALVSSAGLHDVRATAGF